MVDKGLYTFDSNLCFLKIFQFYGQNNKKLIIRKTETIESSLQYTELEWHLSTNLRPLLRVPARHIRNWRKNMVTKNIGIWLSSSLCTYAYFIHN